VSTLLIDHQTEKPVALAIGGELFSVGGGGEKIGTVTAENIYDRERRLVGHLRGHRIVALRGGTLSSLFRTLLEATERSNA